ncbi:MAG: N-acetyltransferase [Clostridia bacterium]|nr:N-acetyltransferase [Clostridia bacterium]
MIIRKPVREEIPALLDIYNYEVENGVATLDINKKTLAEWEIWYDNHNIGNHPLIVCEIDGEIAGYATLSAYREKEAYKSTVELSVYTSPLHRKKGVGTALMEAIIFMAKEDKSIHTVVSVITAGNEASCRLHEKFGFIFCGTIKEVGEKFGRYVDIENYSLNV